MGGSFYTGQDDSRTHSSDHLWGSVLLYLSFDERLVKGFDGLGCCGTFDTA